MNKSLRKAVIAGNWKMNKTRPEAKALIEELKPLVANAGCDVVACVPFTNLETALNAAEVTLTAAQESLAAIETVFVAAIDTSIAAIEAVLSSLQVLEANFPSDIDFNAALTNAETSINEGKAALFAKFESSFQEGKLNEVKVAIDNRKDKLEALVESKKQKVENDTE